MDVPFSYSHGGMAPAHSGRVVEEKMNPKWMTKKKKSQGARECIPGNCRLEKSSWWRNGERALIFLQNLCPILVFHCWIANDHKCSSIASIVSVGLGAAYRLAGFCDETLKG